MKKIIQIGAEAKLYLKSSEVLVKERVKKGYRISEIDEKLRKRRSKREAKVLEKAKCNVPRFIDLKNYKIEMEYLTGDVLKGVLDKSKNKKKMCYELGLQIAKLHESNIIHGDLTTSNAIWQDNKIYLIDFGLSYSSHKTEDRAVDLKLLKQAIESKHYLNFDKYTNWILESYEKNYSKSKEVLERLEKVEKRGRYKRKKKVRKFFK